MTSLALPKQSIDFPTATVNLSHMSLSRTRRKDGPKFRSKSLWQNLDISYWYERPLAIATLKFDILLVNICQYSRRNCWKEHYGKEQCLTFPIKQTSNISTSNFCLQVSWQPFNHWFFDRRNHQTVRKSHSTILWARHRSCATGETQQSQLKGWWWCTSCRFTAPPWGHLAPKSFPNGKKFWSCFI